AVVKRSFFTLQLPARVTLEVSKLPDQPTRFLPLGSSSSARCSRPAAAFLCSSLPGQTDRQVHLGKLRGDRPTCKADASAATCPFEIKGLGGKICANAGPAALNFPAYTWFRLQIGNFAAARFYAQSQLFLPCP